MTLAACFPDVRTPCTSQVHCRGEITGDFPFKCTSWRGVSPVMGKAVGRANQVERGVGFRAFPHRVNMSRSKQPEGDWTWSSFLSGADTWHGVHDGSTQL